MILQCLNGMHVKYGLGKLNCVPYGRGQRSERCSTYGNVVSALNIFSHILKHLL